MTDLQTLWESIVGKPPPVDKALTGMQNFYNALPYILESILVICVAVYTLKFLFYFIKGILS